MPTKPITITAFNPTFTNPAQFTSTVPTNGPGISLPGGTPYPDPTLENTEKLNIEANSQIRNWTPGTPIHTNVTLKNQAGNLLGLAALSFGSITGIPQIGQVGESLVSGLSDSLSGTYTALPLNKLHVTPYNKYSDFRSRLNIDLDSDVGAGNQALAYATTRRLHGLSAATRGSVKAGIYAAAMATPVGAYSIFNLDGGSISGYGWGEHDNTMALRKDFTQRSHVAKRWQPGLTDPVTGKVLKRGEFKPTINPIEMATPFRGDKVNVIDFGKRKLREAYLWNPNRLAILDNPLGMDLNPLGVTQDFIKFYMTGPKLHAGNMLDEDDIIVFRAALTDIGDSISATWSPQTMIGRADPNYTYTGYGRNLTVNFDVYATDRDEMQPIYRKLNALAGYTAPTYNPESITMEGPWMRITIGDLFNQQPVVLTAVSFDYDLEAPWEINIEDDPNMMQTAMKISVNLQFNLITDWLPQKGGRFFSLAKRYSSGTPLSGNDNWLSDVAGNFSTEEIRTRVAKSKTRSKGVKDKSKVGESFITDLAQNGF